MRMYCLIDILRVPRQSPRPIYHVMNRRDRMGGRVRDLQAIRSAGQGAFNFVGAKL
jgi:hypothetical protein